MADRLELTKEFLNVAYQYGNRQEIARFRQDITYVVGNRQAISKLDTKVAFMPYNNTPRLEVTRLATYVAYDLFTGWAGGQIFGIDPSAICVGLKEIPIGEVNKLCVGKTEI